MLENAQINLAFYSLIRIFAPRLANYKEHSLKASLRLNHYIKANDESRAASSRVYRSVGIGGIVVGVVTLGA